MTSIEKKTIPTAEEHFGFQPGEDRKLADWPNIVGYFNALGETSDRVLTEEIGKTTEGNPFLMVAISSPENLANLDKYREIQAKLADPRTLRDETEAAELIAKGKAVVAVTCSIHATEVGATQMSPLLGYNLAFNDDENIRNILDNVILLLIPSLNPDGLIMVKRWYDRYAGTKYDGVNPPYLYHKYTGHDNNRDWFMFTQAETKLTVEHCINKWRPQVLFDLHQTRTNGMRMILPPFVDPPGPNVDPILQSSIAMLGTAIANDMTAQGKAGVAMNLVYDAYSPSRTYMHYHGGLRILSEAASARIASPIHLVENDLKTGRGEYPARKSWNHPMPWKGGRWGLREIVDYDYAAVMACLGNVARYRDTWLRNFHEVGKRAVSYDGNPYAYVVPTDQRDPIAAAELLQVMDTANVELHESTNSFIADDQSYPAGTKVILLQQPYGAFAKTMMETRAYPELRQYPGGPPRTPYDTTSHNLPLQMGVKAVEIKAPFEAKLNRVTNPTPPIGALKASGEADAYLLRPDANASARAINKLLAAGVEVNWAREPIYESGEYYPQGTFVLKNEAGVEDLITSIAREESLTFAAADSFPSSAQYNLRAPRVGLYKSYIPNTEEGWTRFVFEEYRFPYESIVNEEILEGSLAERFDAIVLPHQMVRHIHHGHNPSYYPGEFTHGLGDRGALHLREFVEQGGTLVAWDAAAQYAIHYLNLPVRNVLMGLTHSDFYAPGSLLQIVLDTNHPIAYGMPDHAAAMFMNGPAFEPREGRVVARYPLGNPLLGGLLIGQERLYGKSALLTVTLGRGEVILFGFRVHFRAQARGTYKLLFNSLYYSAVAGHR